MPRTDADEDFISVNHRTLIMQKDIVDDIQNGNNQVCSENKSRVGIYGSERSE